MSIEAVPRAPVTNWRWPWLAALLAPFLSLLVMRPWVRHAFPVWDYAEMLPLLRGSRGILGAFLALTEFYRADGRANFLTYAQIALTWGVAGDNPVGWQLQRAGFMLVAALLLVVVAQRLGARPLAAGLGALLFTVAVSSTEGWLFLMGEPLAVILLLLLVLAAAGYRTTPRWRSRAVLIALLALGVMLSKEVLGVCLPPLVLLAVCWEPGAGFRRPRLGPREGWLAVLLLVVLVAEVISVRAALHDAGPSGYAAAYGGGLELGRLSTLFQAMLLPARFASAGEATLLYPANLAFLLLLILGFARPQEPGSQPEARGSGWWTAGLLWYPVVGALSYALWPRYSAFYGIPFFAASALLFVRAASAIERSHRIGRWIPLAFGGAAIIYSAIVAGRVIEEKHALSDLAVRIAWSFPEEPRLDTLLISTPDAGGRRWPVTARELSRYAIAIGVPDSGLPVMRDAPCSEIARRLALPLGRNAVLNDQNPCGRLPQNTRTWLAPIRYRDWLTLAPLTDTVRVELLAPSWGR